MTAGVDGVRMQIDRERPEITAHTEAGDGRAAVDRFEQVALLIEGRKIDDVRVGWIDGESGKPAQRNMVEGVAAIIGSRHTEAAPRIDVVNARRRRESDQDARPAPWVER